MSQADAVHPNPEVAKRLSHLYTLNRRDIEFRLDESPYDTLLARLGKPQDNLPPVVHFAGTNGKGSAIAFLRSMLEAAGYKVHIYTSPHLSVFNERILLAGKQIDDDTLITLYDHVMDASTDLPLTFFEFTSAIMFLAFKQTPADIVLLETGMGGRLDCSNVVKNPILTAITKISFDHMEFLGDTLPEIAGEKAGIIKQNTPCIIGYQMDEDAVLPVFKNTAKTLNAPLHIAGDDWHTHKTENGFTFHDTFYPLPSLIGDHQIENAGLALACADDLNAHGFTITEDAKKHGLTHTSWPGRLQRITEGPVHALLPPEWELWFDAAHNDSGAAALAHQLKIWKTQNPDINIHLIAGIGADKDAEGFFVNFTDTYDTLTLIDLLNSRKPQTASNLLNKLKNLPLIINYEKTDIREAVDNVVKNHGHSCTKVIICGSLYLYEQFY